MEESKLIAKIKLGDIDAFESLFDSYYNWLCNYIFKLSGNRSVSKDIVQEVMIRLWEKRDIVDIKGSLRSYLFKSCHNQFLQHLRKEKKRPDLLDRIRWDTLRDSYFEEKEEENLRISQSMAKLDDLIEKLPPRCKDVFIMGKLERRKYKEIALEMGISIKTVEHQMSKALKIIRENISLLTLLF